MSTVGRPAAVVVFALVLTAGIITNLLAVFMSAEELSGMVVMRVSMGISLPAVYVSRVAANAASFPRQLLWPLFWTVEAVWAFAIGGLCGSIVEARRSRAVS
jgi:hypothetical protein